MATSKYRFLLILIPILLLNCNNRLKSDKILWSNERLINEFLKSVSLKSKIIDLKISNDTFSIISTSPFLYYPFDENRTIDEFIKRNSFIKPENTRIIKDSFWEIQIYNSKLILFDDKEQNKIQIVSGETSNPEVELMNGIKVGISKNDFLMKFFTKIPKDQLDRIKVIELISGLTGIWHYYNFDKDSLRIIIFKTDYQFDL